MKTFCRLGACLGMIALAGICISCSNKPETPTSGVSDINDTTIMQTTDPTTLPSPEESTSVDTSISSETSGTITTLSETSGTINTSSETSDTITITPPAQRVYPIRNQDAIDLFNAMGLTIKDFSPNDGVAETSTAAFDSSATYYYRYQSYFQKEKATECFETIHDAILKDESGRALEGTCDITKKDGYTILVGSGTYDGMAPIYWVAVIVDKVVVSGFTFSTEESDKQMINNYFIGLGYM